MEETIKEAIKVLAAKAKARAEGGHSESALQLSQAALNLANCAAVSK